MDDISKRLRAARREFFYWKTNPGANNFSALLYDLICKADRENLRRLGSAYPEFVEVWVAYQQSQDPNGFIARCANF